jgi:hypothetical protein
MDYHLGMLQACHYKMMCTAIENVRLAQVES